MSGAELLALRTVLMDRRRTLLDRLAIEAAGGKGDSDHLRIDPDRFIEPGFLRLLSDIQTTIAAVDDELTATGDAP